MQTHDSPKICLVDLKIRTGANYDLMMIEVADMVSKALEQVNSIQRLKVVWVNKPDPETNPDGILGHFTVINPLGDARVLPFLEDIIAASSARARSMVYDHEKAAGGNPPAAESVS